MGGNYVLMRSRLAKSPGKRDTRPARYVAFPINFFFFFSSLLFSWHTELNNHPNTFIKINTHVIGIYIYEHRHRKIRIITRWNERSNSDKQLGAKKNNKKIQKKKMDKSLYKIPFIHCRSFGLIIFFFYIKNTPLIIKVWQYIYFVYILFPSGSRWKIINNMFWSRNKLNEKKKKK